ncbi:MAG: thiamine diphosphokinase [Prevotella sp.]
MKYPLLTLQSRFSHVVLADGDAPQHPIASQILSHANQLVCCDRAARIAFARHLTPVAVVGDGDSIPEELRQHYGSIWHQIPEQDSNDLTKATRWTMSLPSFIESDDNTICYLGATGRREDHTIANISLLAYYLDEFNINPVMVTNHGWFVACHGDSTLETYPRQQVSIFNFSCHQLSATGLKWKPWAFERLWCGSLNEALTDEVNFKADGTYLIFRTFDDCV